jgi:hypothetical protein
MHDPLVSSSSISAGIARGMDVASGRGCLRATVESVRDCVAGALHLACGRGNIWVCAFLLEEVGVDVNPADDTGTVVPSISSFPSLWKRKHT